jgi:cell division protein FtsI/penicillin-binding protein 2
MVESVECPAETNVGGKRFKNAHDMSLPDGPTWNAFAHSCNTTVVNRAENLAQGDLVAMAQRFGIGADWDLGIPAYSGSVPEPKDLVDRAASMIGQGRVLMSPLGMALVAAAVDSGQPRAPVLVPEVKPGGPVGEKLPAGLRTNLRELMRRVVEYGSARNLDLIGAPVHAKTGTAEYGNESPPRTHAWMIGFRGDIAFAVVVEDGGGGGRDAGPVARSFLQESRFVQ